MVLHRFLMFVISLCLHLNYNLPSLYLMLVFCGIIYGELKKLKMWFRYEVTLLYLSKSRADSHLYTTNQLHKQPIHFLSRGGGAKATSLPPVTQSGEECSQGKERNLGTCTVSLSYGPWVDRLIIATRTEPYFCFLDP